MIEWVATEIVTTPNLKHRQVTIKKFIQAAQQCQILQNYSGQLQILLGLQDSSVARLKSSWEVTKLLNISNMFKASRKGPYIV